MGRNGENTPPVDWLRLDNAAKIYPAITGSELTGVFRITISLTSPVNLPALKKASEEASKLFPFFSVELCKGFFWYYLEYNGNAPRVMPDSGPRCQPFPRTMKGELVYRILVRANTISVEFFHILTDGGGGIFFLKTLLNYYFFHLSGIKEVPFPEVKEGPQPGSTDDLFSRHYGKGMPSPDVLPHAWHLPYRLRETPRFHVSEFEVPAEILASVSKGAGSTITEYLAATLLFVLQELRNSAGHGSPHIRVQVPFDLRRRYAATTLRNFSLFAMPAIDIRMGAYSFEEILQEVKITMQIMTDEKRIRQVISRNVSQEKNPLIRIIPLFIKSPVLRFVYNRFGPSQFTTTITNMGKVTPTGPAAGMMQSMSVTPPPPHRDIKITAGLITLGPDTIITFGSLTDSTGLEKGFVRRLTEAGIPVKIHTKEN
ncbi:MAG: hypothetical protein RBT50_07660 [Bacteroidales bacterium]|jgi:hypothetical protein|nr:hypothetical protein [Bacteroidales bacterium]